MRRFSVLLFFVILLISVFSFSVSAVTGTSDNVQEEVWINALDFAEFLSNGNGNTFYNSNALGNLSIPIYTSSPIYNIDVLFSTNFPISNFRVYAGSNYWTFTVSPLGDGRTYRAIGRASGIGESGKVDGQSVLTFKLQSTATSGYITFHQVHYSVVNTMRYDTQAFTQFSFDNNPSYTLSYSGQAVTIFPPLPSSLNDSGFVSWTDLSAWTTYDYIDIVFMTHGLNISSISVVFGDQVLPFISSIIAGNPSYTDNVIISLRVDLRGLIRNSGDYPSICIAGSAYVSDQRPSFSIVKVSGLIIAYDVNPLYIYFNSIRNSFSNLIINDNKISSAIISAIDSASSSIISALEGFFGSSGAGQAAQESAQNVHADVQAGLDSAGNFSKPSSSEINRYLDFNGVISNSSVLTNTAFLTAVFDVPVISKVLTLCMIFALAATILFGKR